MNENGGHMANGASKNSKKLFPQKLWDLIHDERYNFCLRWSEDGQLVYLNRDEFENSYLKTAANQFHTQKAISFVRQMNMYGFRKVDDCFYENDNFKRGCEQLLKNMIRKHPNKSSASSINHANLNEFNSALQNHHHHQPIFRINAPHADHNQQQQLRALRHQGNPLDQRGQHQRHLSGSSSPEATTAAAAIASALVHQQHSPDQSTTATMRPPISPASATSAAESESTMQADCRQRLAVAYPSMAAFGNQAAKVPNGELGPAALANSILTTSTITTTTTTTTTTASPGPSAAETYASQLRESLLAQVRHHQQQQQALPLGAADGLNDDSLSSMSDYCCQPGGSHSATGDPFMNGILETSSQMGWLSQAPQQQQQQHHQHHQNQQVQVCNSQVMDYTGDSKQTQQQLRQRQLGQILQQQQQPQQSQLAAQYTSIYPHGLDPALLEQFRALQAAGQLADMTSQALASSQSASFGNQSPSISAAQTRQTNANNSLAARNAFAGLDPMSLLANSATTTNNGSQTASATAAATAMAAQQLQPGNLQNNLLLNTLIALGILSITSLTQRG